MFIILVLRETEFGLLCRQYEKRLERVFFPLLCLQIFCGKIASMDTTETLKKELLKNVSEKLGVDLVLLFGSRADGSNRKDSDFDIAYSADKNLSSDEESELHIAIMN